MVVQRKVFSGIFEACKQYYFIRYADHNIALIRAENLVNIIFTLEAAVKTLR